LVTKFISISIAVMQTTVRMTELQVTRVAFASNDLPTELVVRQYVTYKFNAGMLLCNVW
jgi:hypothetical protein